MKFANRKVDSVLPRLWAETYSRYIDWYYTQPPDNFTLT